MPIRALTLALAGTLAFAACGAAQAQSATQQIYKWTDASGNVHYASTPPANRKYQTRQVPRHVVAPAATPAVAATPGAAGTTAARPGEHPQCTDARANLAALADANRPVMIDSNGDGKPDRTLTPTERKEHTDLAQKFMSANNCGTATR